LLKIVLQNTIRLEDQGKPLKDWLNAHSIHEVLRYGRWVGCMWQRNPRRGPAVA
jgi:hypothetical protein